MPLSGNVCFRNGEQFVWRPLWSDIVPAGSCKRCCQCHLLLLFLWSCRVSVWQAAASKHPRFQDPILALKLSSLPNSICLFLRAKLFQLYTFFSFNTVTLEFGENFVIMEHSTIWCFQLAFLIIWTLFINLLNNHLGSWGETCNRDLELIPTIIALSPDEK